MKDLYRPVRVVRLPMTMPMANSATFIGIRMTPDSVAETPNTPWA